LSAGTDRYTMSHDVVQCMAEHGKELRSHNVCASVFCCSVPACDCED